MRRFPAEEQVPQIPMTPMIDVVFQLLIFFMLSIHFVQVEGRLLSTLPREKGIAASPTIDPRLLEIRIIVCAGGETGAHQNDRKAHALSSKKGDSCTLLVDGAAVGTLLHADPPDPATRAGNRKVLADLARRIAESLALKPSSRDPERQPRAVLDADAEVPYEHVIGVINACKEAGIDAVDFLPDPRLDPLPPK